MKAKEFTVGYSRTINLGHYESARVEASVTAELRDDEPMIDAVADAQRVLSALLDGTWQSQKDSVFRLGKVG